MARYLTDKRKPADEAIWDLIQTSYRNYYYELLNAEKVREKGYRDGPHPALLIERSTFYWETILYLLKLAQYTDKMRGSVYLPINDRSVYLYILDFVELIIKQVLPCIEEQRALKQGRYIPPSSMIYKQYALDDRAETFLYLLNAIAIPKEHHVAVRQRLTALRLNNCEVLDNYIDLDEVIDFIFKQVGWDEQALEHMRNVAAVRDKKLREGLESKLKKRCD